MNEKFENVGEQSKTAVWQKWAQKNVLNNVDIRTVTRLINNK